MIPTSVKRTIAFRLSVASVAVLGLWGPALAAQEHAVLKILEDELKLSMERLVSADGTKPYYLQYSVRDEHDWSISATLGSLTADHQVHTRQADVDVRCGDYALDNTHQIRGGQFFDPSAIWGGSVQLPLNDDPLSTRYAIWLETDKQFKAAVKRSARSRRT